MSLSLLPIELMQHKIFFGFDRPQHYTNKEVKDCARQIMDISLIDHKFQTICFTVFQKKLDDLKITHALICKYSSYNGDYEMYAFELGLKGPQLFDAVISGCKLPCIYPTVKQYTPEEVEKDIHEIVRVMPESLHWDHGSGRLASRVTPLYGACVNTDIPLQIIEFLVQSGADSKAEILWNNIPTSLLEVIKISTSPERYQEIEKIFAKFSKG
jgi:hypothetical protein